MHRALTRAAHGLLDHLAPVDRVFATRTEPRRLELAVERIHRAGVRIDTVYDIGAHRGTWTEAMRAVLPNAEFVLFEGNPSHADALAATGERFEIALLSSGRHDVDFYATGAPGDSYYREASSEYAGVVPARVRGETLDGLIEELDLPLPDLLKADVQGAELDVLAGGRTALAAATLVLLECQVADYNIGAPSFDDYLRSMREHDFTPIEFLPIRRHALTVAVDVLFATPEAAAHVFTAAG